jgi:hypothetical protein
MVARNVLQSADYQQGGVQEDDMVRDYETPTVPRAWEAFGRRWADRLGLSGETLALVCSPDRYGNAIVLRVVRSDGTTRTSTRRGSDADDAAERRQMFLDAVERGDYTTIELDVAGYYVGEGAVDCTWCSVQPTHEEWQHVILRELLRVAEPNVVVPEGLSPDDADDAERAALDRRVAELLAS